MKIENRHVNLGYAIISFANADQAKQALMMTEGELLLDSTLVQLMAKGTLDHSELDRSYFMRKMKNESQLVDQT